MQFCIQKSTLINICENIILKIKRRRCEERDRVVEELMGLHEKRFDTIIPFFKTKLSHPISLGNALKITSGILPEEFDNPKDKDILCEIGKDKKINYEYAPINYWRDYQHETVRILEKLMSPNISNQVFIDSDDKIYKIAEEFGVEI
jgi:hypothetical protein